MACWMRLRDALQNIEEFADIAKRPLLYYHGQGAINISPKESGWHKEQTILAEDNHIYMPMLYNGEIYLVSRNTDSKGIILCGLEGYENAVVILRNYARTYSNSTLRAEGVILDEETIGLLELIQEEYRTTEGRTCWTAIKECEVQKEPFFVKYGLYCVTPNGREHEVLYEEGGKYGKEAKHVFAYLRPIIHLPWDICVNMQRLKSNPIDEPLEIKLI